jgi:hypothetical protein
LLSTQSDEFAVGYELLGGLGGADEVEGADDFDVVVLAVVV